MQKDLGLVFKFKGVSTDGESAELQICKQTVEKRCSELALPLGLCKCVGMAAPPLVSNTVPLRAQHANLGVCTVWLVRLTFRTCILLLHMSADSLEPPPFLPNSVPRVFARTVRRTKKKIRQVAVPSPPHPLFRFLSA